MLMITPKHHSAPQFAIITSTLPICFFATARRKTYMWARTGVSLFWAPYWQKVLRHYQLHAIYSNPGRRVKVELTRESLSVSSVRSLLFAPPADILPYTFHFSSACRPLTCQH